MKIKDEGYVLKSQGLPIKFLRECYDTDGYSDYMAIKGFTVVDEIRDALFATEKSAKTTLDYYNNSTLHQNVPDFYIVKVNIEYEI